MSVRLGIRRPIKEKQSGTKQETKTTIYNRLENNYILIDVKRTCFASVRKHMSVGLGIRRPIKEKQFKVERNKKRKLQFIIDLIIYIYKCKTNVFCRCSASRDVLLSRLLTFIVRLMQMRCRDLHQRLHATFTSEGKFHFLLLHYVHPKKNHFPSPFH
jgi:hypothetical protein